MHNDSEKIEVGELVFIDVMYDEQLRLKNTI